MNRQIGARHLKAVLKGKTNSQGGRRRLTIDPLEDRIVPTAYYLGNALNSDSADERPYFAIFREGETTPIYTVGRTEIIDTEMDPENPKGETIYRQLNSLDVMPNGDLISLQYTLSVHDALPPIYSFTSTSWTVIKIDGDTKTPVALSPLPDGDYSDTDVAATDYRDITVAPDGQVYLISSRVFDGTQGIVRLGDESPLLTFSEPNQSLIDIEILPGGNLLGLLNSGANTTLLRIDPSNGSILDSEPLPFSALDAVVKSNGQVYFLGYFDSFSQVGIYALGENEPFYQQPISNPSWPIELEVTSDGDLMGIGYEVTFDSPGGPNDVVVTSQPRFVRIDPDTRLVVEQPGPVVSNSLGGYDFAFSRLPDFEINRDKTTWNKLEDGGGVHLEYTILNYLIGEDRPSTAKVALYWSQDDKWGVDDGEPVAEKEVSLAELTGEIAILHTDFKEGHRSPPFGLNEDGSIKEGYLLAVIDPPSESTPKGRVDEQGDDKPLNETNNVYALKLVPLVVVVSTHGWSPSGNPLFSALFDPSDSAWRATRKSFEDIAKNLATKVPEDDSILKNRVEYLVPAWQSSAGFTPAFLALAISKVYRALGNPVGAAINARLASIFAMKSGQLARETARQVAANVKGRLLPDVKESNRLQKIIFIGHSRGAAVNAGASAHLAQPENRDEAYTNIQDFVALDGFSTDWPDSAGSIGDISIIEAAANRKVNYRVFDGLAGAAVEAALEALSSELTSAEPEGGLSQLVKDALASEFGDLRAPNRPGFVNLAVFDHFTDQASNHLSVHPAYRESLAFSESRRYILDNYVGWNRFKGTNATGTPLEGGFDITNAPEIASRGTGMVIDSVREQFVGIVDGSFEVLGELLDQIRDVDLSSVTDPLLLDWAEFTGDGRDLIAALWETTGDVELIPNNSSVRLIQTADTSLGQLVTIPEQAGNLEFDLEVVNAGPDDILQVCFGDSLLGEIRLDEPSVSGHHSIVVSEYFGKTGTITFRLAGPLDNASVVKLDNLFVEGQGNASPLASPDDYQVSAGQSLTVGVNGVLANDVDLDNDRLEASVLDEPAHGELTLNTDGSFTYNPDTDYVGLDFFSYTASDGRGGTTAALIRIDVIQSNVAPTPSIDSISTPRLEGTAISAIGSATNPNGPSETLTFVWRVYKDGSTTPFATGDSPTFTFIPDDDGTYMVTLTVSDEDGSSTTVAEEIVVANVAPMVSLSGDPTVEQGWAFSLAGSHTDPGALDTHTYRWSVTRDDTPVDLAGHDVTGATFAYTPIDTGTYKITLTVADDDDWEDNETRTFTVAAPTAATAVVRNGRLIVVGTNGDDQIKINPGGPPPAIKVSINNVDRTIDGVTEIRVYANGGNDDLKIAGGITVPLFVFGGAGADRLKAGNGNAVLVGGDGDDLLVGGSGRDLLIGGFGSDRLMGNAQDDILVAGWTQLDSNTAALDLIAHEWSRTDSNFFARVANLEAGVGATGNEVYLNDETVHDDGNADLLTGDGGQDWFLFNVDGDGGVADRATDLTNFEAENVLDIDFINGP